MEVGRIKIISRFDEIEGPFTEETLHVLDIDDTVLKWEKDLSNSSLEEWSEYIHRETPSLKDTEFLSFLQGKDYIFITARDPKLFEITEYHLSLLNIPHNGNIYYVGDQSKGSCLKEIRKNEKYRHKTRFNCVDDLKYHLIEHAKRNPEVDIVPYLIS
jgi:hypothetical protein